LSPEDPAPARSSVPAPKRQQKPHIEQRVHSNPFVLVLLGILLASLIPGCGHRETQNSAVVSAPGSPKEIFEKVSKEFHIPSAEAKGTEKLRLQSAAAAGYQDLLKRFPNDEYWAAQARRSLGNIYSAQTNLDAAVREYELVNTRYPKQEWEVLMAWKSAADLYWEANRRAEANQFYRKIVERFDRAEAAQIVKSVVRGSKLRLSGTDIAG